MNGSMASGFISGAAAGGATAFAVDKKRDPQMPVMGALIGGVTGAISAYFIHEHIEKRDAKTRRDTLFNLDKFDVSIPSHSRGLKPHALSLPIVDSEHIEEHVTDDGKKLVEEHKVWTIREDAQLIPKSQNSGE